MIRFPRITTMAALGFANVARVVGYRIGLRTGLHPVLRLRSTISYGPFFCTPTISPSPLATARQSWSDQALYFGIHRLPVDEPPNWHANPFRPGVHADSTQHWSRIPDFDLPLGDIKTVWESSRFDWLVAMSQRAAMGDVEELTRLNEWLSSWTRSNPPYFGVNWKCGQEASIRVMHLAVAALLLDQVERPREGLVGLVKQHLARIAPTMCYAVAQQNNHGTSEAAALFIGGSWLESLGVAEAANWRRTGVRWLESCARVLIEPDGTFSQYSVNYQRVMLDTYSLAEIWRRQMGLPVYSAGMIERLSRATEWLRQLTDCENGDAPNLGANDGARLIALTDTDFRDFRPTIQLAAALFSGWKAYEKSGPWDQPLIWLRVNTPVNLAPEPKSKSFDAGGLHVLRRGGAKAILRYPRFRFRPSHADALHLDFWIEGENVLRDAGSYSYNASEEDTAYFSGTASHNTVEFDRRDQMSRLGRFLFGSWLKARRVIEVSEDGEHVTAAAGYRDDWGATHDRQVWLLQGRLICEDVIGGRADSGTLRWRLTPGAWEMSGNTVSNGKVRIAIEANSPIRRMDIAEGIESRYYLLKTVLPVLEVEVGVPATLRTDVRF